MSEDKGFPALKPPGTLPKIGSIFDFSAEALGELMTYIAQNPPPIPISQVIGFQQFTVQAAAPAGVEVNETTTSTTYADLATSGPVLTGLPAGKYLILFGGVAKAQATGNSAYMSPSLNGATPTDSNSAKNDVSTAFSNLCRAITTTLSSDSNSVKIQYKTQAAGLAGFQTRWLIALKYANA